MGGFGRTSVLQLLSNFVRDVKHVLLDNGSLSDHGGLLLWHLSENTAMSLAKKDEEVCFRVPSADQLPTWELKNEFTQSAGLAIFNFT